MLRTHPWRFAAVLAIGVVACVSTWPAFEDRSYHRTGKIADAEVIGADECLSCHEDVHGHAPAPEYHADCETCHGAGSVHAESEEPADIRYPSDRDCLTCHERRSAHLGWGSSEHRRSGVLCSDCHATHDREPKHLRTAEVGRIVAGHAQRTTQLCVSCHTDVASRLELPSHHPIAEGMLDCTDCHAPHESQRVTLGARTELCTGCHQDYAGPWIFEHPPAAEDCGYCHTPHGAASHALLEPSQPGTCISCHSLPTLGATHDPSAFVTNCSDCHSAIHGSYTDPHLRR